MLADVLGQSEVAGKFLNAWRQGRLGHAYILSGPDGIGKTPFATELAKALLCTEGGDDACERCASCRKVQHGNHEDIEILEPSGKGYIIHWDQMQAMIESLRLKTRSGEHRFVIIREADRMREETANHFLKTLEEPPTEVTFFLLSARLPALRETVISRCQIVRLRRTPPGQIEKFLLDRGYCGEEAKLYASLCDGCPGRAVGMRESGVFERRERVLLRIIGLNPENESMAAAEMVAANRGRTMAETRENHYTDLGLMATLFRDMALMAEGADGALLYNPDVAEKLRSRAASATPDRLRVQALRILEARNNIERIVNPDLVISRLFLELSN